MQILNRSISTASQGHVSSDLPRAWAWDNSLRWQGSVAETEGADTAVPIHVIEVSDYSDWLRQQPLRVQQWLSISGIKGKHRDVAVLPHPQEGVEAAVFVCGNPHDMWAFAALAAKLPPATTYALPDHMDTGAADRAALAWILAHYKFRRYKGGEANSASEVAVLQWPRQCSKPMVEALARSYYFCRDLINTPAEDCGPQHLAAEVAAIAATYGATLHSMAGEQLLEHNYPAVHTVGRASHRPPMVMDLQWHAGGKEAGGGGAQLPLVALVGKGVCFDTGGLDLKSAAGMRLMKKDMGGAAFVLALSHLVMSAGLPVALRVLVPAVENAVSANSYRPLDVLQTRAGITVENGNTDAEGRLILCDCLYEAACQQPDLLVDVATLTGAARAALGPEVPALFCNDDALATQLLAAAQEQGESLWRLPLHAGYRKLLDSKVADLGSTGGEGSPGAIAAALFLQEFIKDSPRWVHMDTGAWTTGNYSGPGRPEGGEALGLLSFWHFLLQRYAPSEKPKFD